MTSLYPPYPPIFYNCKNIRCDALVSVGTLYCCVFCRDADERGYEIHEHSDGCKIRQAERWKK